MSEKPHPEITPVVREALVAGPTHGERRALAHLREMPRLGGKTPFARNADKWRSGLVDDISARGSELDSPPATLGNTHAKQDKKALATFREMMETWPSATQSRDR